jgi:hypothetical protein
MDKAQFLNEYGKCLKRGSAALFVGAGLSRQAGYPDWRGLLKGIAADLRIDLRSEHDLAGVAQWYLNKNQRTKAKIGQLIRDSFPDVVDVPESHRVLARLPFRHVWTTNYDNLLERAWTIAGRRMDVKAVRSDLSVFDSWADTTLYKMHGSVAHPSDVVIATDDYELYRRTRSAFVQLLNGHLIGQHFLFLGFGFSDPNIGHLLGIIRETMDVTPTPHYAIVRKPKRGVSSDAEALHDYQVSRHSHWVADMHRYGIECVEVDEFDEIEDLLAGLEGKISSRSVFVSGSYAQGRQDPERSAIERTATILGESIAEMDLRLISGVGAVVGNALVSGFLGRLYTSPNRAALEQRLLLRPFPSTPPGGFTKEAFQRRYREDLIRNAGICVFVGGYKEQNGRLVNGKGVEEEFKIAKASGKVLIPIAATGGTAAAIWHQLQTEANGKGSRLPPEIFARLGNAKLSPEEIGTVVTEAMMSAMGHQAQA